MAQAKLRFRKQARKMPGRFKVSETLSLGPGDVVPAEVPAALVERWEAAGYLEPYEAPAAPAEDAGEAAPGSGSGAPEEPAAPDFYAMTLREMSDYAAEHGIVVPSDVTKHDDVAAFLSEHA